MSNYVLSCITSVALALALTGQAGATTITVGGTGITGEGQKTSVVGAATITFDCLTKLPHNFQTSGNVPNSPLVSGSSSGNYAAPDGDNSTYLSTGRGAISEALAPGTTYFGFYWGSVDAYNDFSITDTGGHTFSINGSQLACDFGILANKGASYFVNLRANDSASFVTATFASGSNAFEFDNVATAAPEPAGAAMLAGGLLIFGGLLRRRRA